jgi:hypothetical protein
MQAESTGDARVPLLQADKPIPGRFRAGQPMKAQRKKEN